MKNRPGGVLLLTTNTKKDFYPKVPRDEGPASRSPVTSHGSCLPLSTTGQSATPSPMHIIIMRSSPLFVRGSPVTAVLEVVMDKTLKIVLTIVGVLIVLVLVAPFLIPVNQFRPTIEEKASASLGRKVELGNLSLSLLSGSLSADNISIGDDPKFSSSPFLTAKSLKVGVEVMPLIFSKTLNVTGVTIDTPQVTLLHTGAGLWNYSSFGAAAAKSQGKPAPPSSQAFSIAKLELRNGRIIIGSTNSQKRSTYDKV